MKTLRKYQSLPPMRQELGKAGFALVATLSLMVLLVILAVGMLSLSAVTLRSSGQGAAQAEARANARMALMVAIGELQKQMGPDQRISANGAILSDSNVNHPLWTGVWDSWIAGSLPAGRNPLYPSSASHQQTIGNPADPTSMHPKYSEKSKHFRAWLLSLDPAEAGNIEMARTLALDGKESPGGSDTAVLLVGKNSTGSTDAAGHVSARLLPVKRDATSAVSGRYGWWVGDESQKARLLQDSYSQESAPSLAKKLARTQAPASTGTAVMADLAGITPVQEKSLSRAASLGSLNLVVEPGAKPAQKNFHTVTTDSAGVLADVREGGLKRDLSTILERTIDPNEVYDLQTLAGVEADFKRATALKTAGPDFMLYNFDDMSQSTNGKTGEACVPIQDLAAYYQLYDHSRSGWKGGIQFTTTQSSPSHSTLNGGIMVSNPNYGATASDYNLYLRHHSALYRNVYPVKMEFVLSYITEPRPQADIDSDRAGYPTANPPVPPNPDPDTHWLKVGYTPSMTFWNPNNVPVVMNRGNPEFTSIMVRENAVPMQITLRKHTGTGGPVQADVPARAPFPGNLGQRTIQLTNITNTQQGELYTLFIAGNEPLVFQPGESKVLALQYSSLTAQDQGQANLDFYLRGTGYRMNEPFVPLLELKPGWNPLRFIRPTGRNGAVMSGFLTFKPSNSISAVITAGTGRTFNVDFAPKGRHGRNAPGVMWHYRSYGLSGRTFPGGNPDVSIWGNYRTALLSAGLNPGTAIAATTMGTGISIAERSGLNLITSMRDPANMLDDLPQSFFYYGMKASTETQEKNNNQVGAARRFPSRPFTHSTVMMPQFIDRITGSSLYNNGWNWYFMPLDNFLGPPVSISMNNHGYYGGGYTAENGTTHVVQQELPLIPPMSIAALSHAQLSGYSLSSESAAAGFGDLPGRNNPAVSESFRRTTAIGYGGLEPRTLQAIGNSYAHPFIPKDRAITTLGRVYYQGTAAENPIQEPYADHSYLANKALWDDYFFSSITPVPSNNPIYNEPARTIDQVTRDFISQARQLPNRRMVPYEKGLDDSKITSLLSLYSQYKDGFADKIAANMMMEGAFNINSTSEAAWKIFLSSLRGKSVTYLEPSDAVSGSLRTKDHQPDGVPVGTGALANGKPVTGSSADPSDAEQWTGWRELTDKEIGELAKAMVKQVKKRGPFLSMSEFVNRRLDSGSDELSAMGALQAAIDDPDCSINAGFRDALRKFSTLEKTYANAVFPRAMEGAVAYGSSAYVDQADILRNFAEQLTPRGDTFVIRAYGDSLDADGKVVARTWCEAVVQRTPEYLDAADEPHVKQAGLTCPANVAFGRRFEVVRFRWLHSSEI